MKKITFFLLVFLVQLCSAQQTKPSRNMGQALAVTAAEVQGIAVIVDSAGKKVGRLLPPTEVKKMAADTQRLSLSNGVLTLDKGGNNVVLPYPSLTTFADSLANHRNNINYVRAISDTRDDSLKTALNAKAQPDWNATTGFSAILNKPQITSQWSFLGNVLAGNPAAFLGTTDNTDLVFKQENIEAIRIKKDSILVDGEYFYGQSLSAIGGSANGLGTIAIGGSASGYNSIALGLNTTANGGAAFFGATAINNGIGFGSGTTANGGIALGNEATAINNGIALGTRSISNSENSVSIGYESVASGLNSIALGTYNNSQGRESVTLGFALLAKAMGGSAFGVYNDISDSPSNLVGAPSDRLFQIGNGERNSGTRSNALTILRSGNVSIGSNYAPTEKLEVSGRIKSEKLQLTQSITPSSTTDPQGNLGDICKDENYIYVKCGQGWKRSALSTF